MSKHALLVGSASYSDQRLPPLTSPIHDAAAFAELLNDPTRGGFDEVVVLVDAPERDIRIAVATMLDGRAPDDLVLVYFSGHGVLDPLGNLYFATVDTQLSRLSATALPDTFVRERLDQSHARHQLLLLDCCHSGAFAKGQKGIVGGSVGTAARFGAPGHGRVVLTASDSTQYAWDGDDTAARPEHSLFTHHLIEGLTSGQADAAGKGIITADDLYDYLLRHIPGSRQRPMRFGDPDAGSMVLARNPRPKALPLPDDIRTALDDRRTWIRKAAVGMLAALLGDQKGGLSRAATDALAKVRDADDSTDVRHAAAAALAGYVVPAARVATPAVMDVPVAPAVIAARPQREAINLTPAPALAPAASLAAHDRTRAVILSSTLLMAFVFAVNWVETYFESTVDAMLDRLLPWSTTSYSYMTASAMIWIERHFVFINHDQTNIVAIYGYSFAYFVVFPVMGVIVAIALARRDRAAPYRVFVRALAIDYAVSLVFFLAFPVPERWTYPESGAILLSDMLPDGWGYWLIDLFRPMSALNNCFPSFHVSMTVVTIASAYLFGLRYRTVVAAFGGIIVLSTLVLGIHWTGDVLAGIALGLLSTWVAARRPWPSTPPVAGGVACARSAALVR